MKALARAAESSAMYAQMSARSFSAVGVIRKTSGRIAEPPLLR
ncbi:hypothetical protein RKLH11_4092 [Rhodobacteraceae bacterium KLH11]|nr:hypothetical protein RKLH11_4092 [Rhodobacteraceae bacterium KLH11]